MSEERVDEQIDRLNFTLQHIIEKIGHGKRESTQAGYDSSPASKSSCKQSIWDEENSCVIRQDSIDFSEALYEDVETKLEDLFLQCDRQKMQLEDHRAQALRIQNAQRTVSLSQPELVEWITQLNQLFSGTPRVQLHAANLIVSLHTSTSFCESDKENIGSVDKQTAQLHCQQRKLEIIRQALAKGAHQFKLALCQDPPKSEPKLTYMQKIRRQIAAVKTSSRTVTRSSDEQINNLLLLKNQTMYLLCQYEMKKKHLAEEVVKFKEKQLALARREKEVCQLFKHPQLEATLEYINKQRKLAETELVLLGEKKHDFLLLKEKVEEKRVHLQVLVQEQRFLRQYMEKERRVLEQCSKMFDGMALVANDLINFRL